MNDAQYLILDIGGTSVKGCLCGDDCENILGDIHKVSSRLHEQSTVDEFILSLDELIGLLNITGEIQSIGISTAGVVNYAGNKIEFTAPHLQALCHVEWEEYLKERFSCPVVLINDADAVAIGASAAGYLQGYEVQGVMPVGTGIGFVTWRNGRKWTPNFSYTLLGSIQTPQGSFDQLGGVPYLLKECGVNDLVDIFQSEEYRLEKERYCFQLSCIVNSAHVVFGVNKVWIGGGLVDALLQTEYPLLAFVEKNLNPGVEVGLMKEGNSLALWGTYLLAKAEKAASKARVIQNFGLLSTEQAYDAKLCLQDSSVEELVSLLLQSEQEAGERLAESSDQLARVIDEMVRRLENGGRIFYVGAGTSGRLAAIDAVELACTYGWPREKALTFIAGGVADAAIDIETRFEEDASSVPELLMAGLSSRDVVIGISVSGSAYYVKSALAYAQSLGCASILIQEAERAVNFCDYVIPLRSGGELVAGSTRMKAGTATKKVLNFLSTATMIRLGKVHGVYMTELECLNEKLIARATRILNALFSLNEETAYQLLSENDFVLNQAIQSHLRRSS